MKYWIRIVCFEQLHIFKISNLIRNHQWIIFAQEENGGYDVMLVEMFLTGNLSINNYLLTALWVHTLFSVVVMLLNV